MLQILARKQLFSSCYSHRVCLVTSGNSVCEEDVACYTEAWMKGGAQKRGKEGAQPGQRGPVSGVKCSFGPAFNSAAVTKAQLSIIIIIIM